MHSSSKPPTASGGRGPVERIDSDSSITWAYDTPLTAPRRGLDPEYVRDTELAVVSEVSTPTPLAPLEEPGDEAGDDVFDNVRIGVLDDAHDGTISPLFHPRRDTPPTTEHPAEDHWEQFGIGVLILGGTTLIMAAILAFLTGILVAF